MLLVPAIACAVVVVQTVHLAFLASFPPVFIDEAWNANAVWNWWQTGVNFDSMHAGTFDQFGYEWLRWPTLGNAPWLASIAAFGLGLFQMRLVSWVAGCVLLISTALAGRRSYGSLTAALAALLVSLSAPFLQASHYARWDITLAAVVMTAFVLASRALDTNRWHAHLVAGLLIGASVDIHMNGILFAPALGVMYLAAYGRRTLAERGTWLCALGGALGLGYFFVVKVLPNPAAYSALFDFSYTFTHRAPVYGWNPFELLASLRAEVGRYHFFEHGLDFALICASLVYLAVRRSDADRRLLLFAGVAFLNFVLFVGNKHDVYAILLYPFMLLMVAETLVSLVRDGHGARAQPIFVGALSCLLVLNSAVHVSRAVDESRGYDYYAITNRIREVAPEGARIVGLPNWWLGLADYDYRSVLNITFYHFLNGLTLTQGLETIRPEFIIVDDNLRGLLVDQGYFPSGPGFEVYRLPKREFETFLQRRASKVLDFVDPWHGQFEIYAVQWGASDVGGRDAQEAVERTSAPVSVRARPGRQ